MSIRQIYRIRKPDRSELEYLARMGQEMHAESALKDLNYDLHKAEAWLLSAFKHEHVFFFRVIVDEHDVPIGGMIGQISETYYGHSFVANDAIVMVQKEHRSKCIDQLRELANMYKEWALQRARVVFLGTTTGIEPEHTERVYEAFGFKKIGTVHACFKS